MLTRPKLKLVSLIFCAVITLLFSCARGPFVPVNVGREYGNPTTPHVVSHLGEKNKWALARTRPHNIFQQILCFHYPCRKMIGRRKSLQAISMKEFKRRIERNARKGVYKHLNRTAPAQPKKENPIIIRDSARVATITPSTSILKSDSLITLSDVLFEVNSYQLKNKHFTQLDSLSSFLTAHPLLEVSVSGHTDNTGNEKHNVTLSMRRAQTVAQYLIDKGIDDEKVFFEGFGSSKPIKSNETEEGKRANRRVEILIRNPKK
ncbi:MAG: OmpA family protein [Cyclobacteriaceae bacterium]